MEYTLTKAERYAVLAVAERRQRLIGEVQEAEDALRGLAQDLARAHGLDSDAPGLDFGMVGDSVVLIAPQPPDHGAG